MRTKFIPSFAAVLIAIALAGCGSPFVRSELYFGLSRAAGPEVTPAQWQAFVDEVITPKFPEGLTVLDGNGQWLMHDGSLAKEKSKVVVLVHPSTNEESRKLDEIRDEFKKRFSQEAVLEVDEDARIKF